MNTKSIISDYNIDDLLDKISTELKDYLKQKNIEEPIIVGIHTAGVWVAEHLHKALEISEPLGELNISFYRDDFDTIGLHHQIEPSQLPPSVENKHIILVDDVLYTGRTIRAAMNEIFDYGRPASITLVVLIDRGNHELPIKAQVIGFKDKIKADRYFKLSNENNTLELRLETRTGATDNKP